jgi:nucleoside-diphosphate-sugar epimerase
MKAFVTGATGFIGGRVATKLRERGDQVVALVRSPHKAAALRGLGCDLVEGDLSDGEAIRAGLEGCDAAFHVAAIYRVGIPPSERPGMHEANVKGTERVLDAAIDAGVSRIVYVSTIGVFGNTRGQVVDEGYQRPANGFLSAYDETKYLAHQAAVERIAKGAPILIAQPGGVYGPGDTSDLANLIKQVRTGRLKFLIFPEVGFNFLHVDDAADGILLVHDKGQTGQCYVLGGQLATLGDLIRTIAVLSGRKPPRHTLPPAVARMAIPIGPLIGKLLGQGPNLRELIASADGATYWATDAKARRDLGYSPRDLDTGMKQTLAASLTPLRRTP